MDVLSVPETYFWREMDQIRAVVDEVVPRWIDRLKGQPLRIWSVPCATGEEALTLAMVPRRRLVRAGADRDPRERRERGGARPRSRRRLPRALVSRPARPRARAVLHAHRRRMARQRCPAARVSWSRVNVVASGQGGGFAASPSVFCRSLFIYFSEASIRRVLELLAKYMPSAGYLCLGVSESIMKLTKAFELEQVQGAFVYVKR